MKRLICIALALALSISTLALAENAFQFVSAEREQALTDMLPVLDSLARCLNVDSPADANGDRPDVLDYEPGDAAQVWNQLRLLGVNWLAADSRYQVANGEARVPSGVINDCALASYASLAMPLPEMPTFPDDGLGAMRYDDASNAYIIVPGTADTRYAAIERYAEDGDALVVTCGLYDGDTGVRRGGLTARMTPVSLSVGTPAFPYQVTEAHAEQSSDYDNLKPVACSIRRQETAQPTAEPTLAPTAAPTADPAQTASYEKLSSGSRGEAVRRLQERLNALGYNCGRADGVFGKGTKRAVRYFQDAIGAKQDGVANAALQRRLFASDAPRFQPYVNLKKGSKGIRVEDLQERLRELGFDAEPADGDFGTRTTDAVKLFQQAAGLKADGIAGVRTLKALERKDAPKCTTFISLKKDDSGPRVAEMQQQLAVLGLYTGKVNGNYDKATIAAVQAFKQARKIPGDGKDADAAVIAQMFAPVPADPTPTPAPSDAPTTAPSDDPTTAPSDDPTTKPSDDPTDKPTDEPTDKPTDEPTDKPTDEPTTKPTDKPTDEPTTKPADEPTTKPADEPTTDPGDEGGTEGGAEG